MKKRVVSFFLACIVAMAAFTACGAPSSTQSASGSELANSEAASQAANIGTPDNPTKIRIEVFDRGNVPEGKGTVTDNRWTQWLKEEALKAGFDLEWVACPRDQEVEKLNAWMATGSAPDLVFTYDATLFTSFAQQGGIWELDDLIAEYGPHIEETVGYLLPQVSYQGKVYGLTGQSAFPTAAPLKIRQDWLDILDMPVPTTIDELTEVLRAFKEKDPGNVGSENVVPFAIPAPGTVGLPGAYLNLMFPFGVRDDAGYNNGFACMPSGNYDEATGEFRSPVDLPEAKEFYRWMNQLYKEGLLPLEFAIDTTGEKYMQYVASGVAGFVDQNALDLNPNTIDAVPTVDWEPIEPLKGKDGSQRVQLVKKQGMRMYIMIPKTTENPGEVVRYFDWLIENNVNDVISNGFEGEHYKLVEGVKIAIDKEYNAKDIFNATDMNLTGFTNQTYTPNDKLYLQYENERDREIVIKAREFVEKYGAEDYLSLVGIDRPVNMESGAALKKYMYEGAAKVIVAEDFEAEYKKYVDGWYQLGGGEFDAELAAAIQQAKANLK
ncbi:extracellular solute-binding protein [Ruthenibacterium lactatiformans]|uniref:Extracellular solute-binding protein n=1 Tax=Ruthenibacterium lactatiformans TaxID=1550024 RepID=A0A6L6LXG1_9FIRM|nr:extracellular solute-binding protein [Ruthenibacterium lactatiformans]EHL63783.1 hypothetical protein HMPREF1032_03699 [Subdoligranulum sp. 4_3_54A2FAA]MTQ82305.1 extracellular solute-binding protein [Ruthenibacterium lactatiformans]MTS22010.1 extracellular solute-binding protein [Ruthenibacterium lactatiformans]MTS29028.1 extracellular solute-binding protein [Ruthenibacterium lactatiformans]MTS32682.1 extracellular solute-binding protein [Ruthenibacterium lactatiformans]